MHYYGKTPRVYVFFFFVFSFFTLFFFFPVKYIYIVTPDDIWPQTQQRRHQQLRVRENNINNGTFFFLLFFYDFFMIFSFFFLLGPRRRVNRRFIYDATGTRVVSNIITISFSVCSSFFFSARQLSPPRSNRNSRRI